MSSRGRMPRHSVRDEMRGFREGPPPLVHRGRGHMPPPIPPVDEQLAMGHDEIRRLATGNRILVEENIGMKRELNAVREELHALGQEIPRVRAEKEAKARELIQRGLQLDAELRSMEPIKAEARELKSEAQKLDAIRQDLSTKVQSMTKDLKRLQAENQQIPKLRRELEGLHEDLVRVRTGCEYEQKLHAEHMEQRLAMENNLMSMAREIEKLRADHMGLDKKARRPGTGAYAADMGYLGSFGDGFSHDKGMYGPGAWPPYEPRGFPRH